MREVLDAVRLHEGSATDALRRLVTACEPVSPYLALMYSQSQEFDLGHHARGLGRDRHRDHRTVPARAARRRLPARPDRGLADRGVLQPHRRDRLVHPRGPRRRPRLRPTHHRPTTQRSDNLMTRRWLALGVLTLAVLLIGIDGTVLALATPFISADLGATGTQLLWIGDIYSFVLAGAAGQHGHPRRPHRPQEAAALGATAFAVRLGGHAVRAERRDADRGTRALLGVAGATLMPVTLALIRTLFPDPRERSIAVGIWAAGFSAGAALGPVVGGVLLRALLVGLGLPDQRPGDGGPGGRRRRCCCPSTATPTRARGTCPAWPCPWSGMLGAGLRDQGGLRRPGARARRGHRGRRPGRRGGVDAVRPAPTAAAHPLIDVRLFRQPAVLRRRRRQPALGARPVRAGVLPVAVLPARPRLRPAAGRAWPNCPPR